MTQCDGYGRLRHEERVSTCLSPWCNPGVTLTVGNAHEIRIIHMDENVSVPDGTHAPAEFRQEIRCLLRDA